MSGCPCQSAIPAPEQSERGAAAGTENLFGSFELLKKLYVARPWKIILDNLDAGVGCLDVLGADTSCTKSGLKFQTLQSLQQSYVQLASGRKLQGQQMNGERSQKTRVPHKPVQPMPNEEPSNRRRKLSWNNERQEAEQLKSLTYFLSHSIFCGVLAGGSEIAEGKGTERKRGDKVPNFITFASFRAF